MLKGNSLKRGLAYRNDPRKMLNKTDKTAGESKNEGHSNTHHSMERKAKFQQ